MIALVTEAVSNSKTAANFYETTTCSIPEGCHLLIRRRENMQSIKTVCSEHYYYFVKNISLGRTKPALVNMVCTRLHFIPSRTKPELFTVCLTILSLIHIPLNV
jgi:hypothetical protein